MASLSTLAEITGLAGLRIPLLLTIVLTLGFAVVSTFRLYRHPDRPSLPHYMQALFLSATVGFLMGFGIFPAWFFILQFIRGNALDDSLYPGQSGEWLVGTLFIGTLAFGALALYTWFRFGRSD